MLLTDESLPLGAAAAATGRLASFAPSTLAPLLPVMEDIVILGDGIAEQQWTLSEECLAGRFVSVDVAVDGLRGGFFDFRCCTMNERTLGLWMRRRVCV